MTSRDSDGRVFSVGRRDFLVGLAGTAGLGLTGAAGRRLASADAGPSGNAANGNGGGEPTRFKIACMTLPYRGYPLQRALTGIADSGFEYVAWGTSHREEDGQTRPAMAPDAPASEARELGDRCRDLGLDPVMMFSRSYPDHDDFLEVMRNRIRQAEAGGVDQILTYGRTQEQEGERPLWIERLKELGPMARDHGVLIVAKPHGGVTETGKMNRDVVREVDDAGVRLAYDAGNVMHYPQWEADQMHADYEHCAEEVYSFCIKDYRQWPDAALVGPGLGEQDHYRLMRPVAMLGRDMPLCLENISVPFLNADSPEVLDAWAKRAREFLELVTAGVLAEQA